MDRRLFLFGLTLGVAIASVPSPFPQPSTAAPITALGSSVIRVRVTDLLDTPSRFHDRMVEVAGRLRPSDWRDASRRIHRLAVLDGHRSVRLALPLGRTEDLRVFEDQSVRVTGTFWDLALVSKVGFYWGCPDLQANCFVPRDSRLARYPSGLLRLPGSECLPCDLERDDNQYFIGVQTVESLEENTTVEELAESEVNQQAIQQGPLPEVIFTLPLNEERNIPLESEFLVQFSADMDPMSFHGNVEVSYIDDTGEEGAFVGINLRYDSASRALVIDPVASLEPGKKVQLVLYEGIQDDEGLRVLPPLLSRRAESPADGSRKIAVLTFTTKPESR